MVIDTVDVPFVGRIPGAFGQGLSLLAMKTAGRPEHQQRHEWREPESQMQAIKHGGPGCLGQRAPAVAAACAAASMAAPCPPA